MPNILFASNNISHFPTLLAGSVVDTFDENRVPYSFALKNFETVTSPVFTPSAGEDTWFHFLCYPGTTDSNRTDHWFSAYDALGRILFRLAKTNNTILYLPTAIIYDGNTTSTVGGTIGMTQNKINFVDIHYKKTALLLEVKVYINGALSLTRSFGANPNAYGNPVFFALGTGFTNSLSNICHVSEVIVADDDTRNARLNLLRPAAAGAANDFLGSLATLVDDDTTTGMTTLEPGARQTTTLTPYTGAQNISNFVSVSSTTRGENSPTKMKHTVRLSGVNYDGPEIPLGFPLQYNITDFKTNPATSLPWVGSDLSAIESGFLSVA